MGIFSKFEGRVEDTFEGAANKMFDSPISPVQIAKKAEKQMRREKMVGAGKQYAPTLYTVLVNQNDDQRLFGYYPTLAGETETYLKAKAMEEGLVMDGQPLVRFIADEGLKKGKFEIIAEMVAAPIIEQLRQEEMERYNIAPKSSRGAASQIEPERSRPRAQSANRRAEAVPAQMPSPQPMEDEDYSDDYGIYGYSEEDYEEEAPKAPVANDRHRRTSEPILDRPQSADIQAGSPIFAIPPVRTPSFDLEPVHEPNTVAFVQGSGNAAPQPDVALVRACLIDTTDNRSYSLATNRILLGRELTNDVIVDDINASRVHAELALEPQGVWVISDLGSTNGTQVNNEDIESFILQDGDVITVGTTKFVFVQA